MANDVLKAVALVTRDLLGIDEQLIKIGRENYPRDDFDTQLIVIDDIGPGERVGNLETFDGTGEVKKYGALWKHPITLDFFAFDAYNRAIEYSLLLQSQTAAELMRTNGINIYHPKGPIDVKGLTGQQYGERVQIEMTVEMSREASIDTLRIDTAQLIISNEDGELYNG